MVTFRVGQKVVCVDASTDPPPKWIHEGLVKGRIYVVAGFAICRDGNVGPTFHFDPGWPYRAFRFRAIVSRKTDISSLEALLLPNAKILEGV